MTSNAHHLKWKIAYLASVLICQTTWQVEGRFYEGADEGAWRSLQKRDVGKHHVNASSPKPPEQTSARENQQSTTDGKIVFPDEKKQLADNTRRSGGGVPTPQVCQGKTFCENVNNYPRNLVDLALQQNSSLHYMAVVDVATGIAQRIEGSDDISLCSSEEKVIYPQSAENMRNEWLFVVNQDNFRQGIRVELCNEDNQRCNVIDGLVHNTYQTKCKQKFVVRQLLALGSQGNPVTDQFRFPVSCCCYVKHT